MAFGKYGREDGALVLCHKSGALTIKYLQRNAGKQGGWSGVVGASACAFV
jgi:hypothetical protein